MKRSKLSDHKFIKGKFITPIHSISIMHEFTDEESWVYGRMPEYLWIGLILKKYGRKNGLNKLYYLVKELHKLASNLSTARISQIIKLESDMQDQFFRYVLEIISKDTLSPLTIFLTSSKAPIFSKYFFSGNMSVEDRTNILMETMSEIMDHQTFQSTDIRYVALYFNLLLGKMHLMKNEVELLQLYPNLNHEDEAMKMIRPIIRSTEMMIMNFEKIDYEYLQMFWRYVSDMTDCSIYSIVFPEETRNTITYMDNLADVFDYLSELFISTSPLDEKMCVLLGIATYSYKRLLEVCEHNLFNTISGRSSVRVLIENYIMIKYLVKNESLHDNIWKDYKLYGLGLYKLVLARYREFGGSVDSHFDEKYIEELVNEFQEEEFIDMDTKYFDKQNIRIKAESVDEKKLYGLYYDYDSSFEHGLWGAIRESSMVKCNNPAHQYHCIPDINEENRLKSVWPDCVMVMNKTLIYIDELYGIPKQLLDEVINFEIEPISRKD